MSVTLTSRVNPYASARAGGGGVGQISTSKPAPSAASFFSEHWWILPAAAFAVFIVATHPALQNMDK